MKRMEVPQVASSAAVNKPQGDRVPAKSGTPSLKPGPFGLRRTYFVADITALVAIDLMKPAKLDEAH